MRAEANEDGIKLLLELPECVKKCSVLWKDGSVEEIIGAGMHILQKI